MSGCLRFALPMSSYVTGFLLRLLRCVGVFKECRQAPKQRDVKVKMKMKMKRMSRAGKGKWQG